MTTAVACSGWRMTSDDGGGHVLDGRPFVKRSQRGPGWQPECGGCGRRGSRFAMLKESEVCDVEICAGEADRTWVSKLEKRAVVRENERTLGLVGWRRAADMRRGLEVPPALVCSKTC